MSSPLADLIQRGESGAASYDSYNRGTSIGDDGKEHVRGPDRAIDFSSLSIARCLTSRRLRAVMQTACLPWDATRSSPTR